MQRFVYAMAVLVAVAAGHARAGFITINFDDPGHSEGQSVGATYSALGVTFDNTMYTELGALPGGSGPNAIASVTGGFFPKQATAIVGTFAAPQTTVTITGLDVGSNGIRIDVYDAEVGGNLIGSSEAFGSTLGGSGLFYTLSVSQEGIRRFELYQPQSVLIEGVAFDNLTFSGDPLVTPVPAPSGLVLGAIGAVSLLGCGGMRRRKQAA